jgi:hypothetical protein
MSDNGSTSNPRAGADSRAGPGHWVLAGGLLLVHAAAAWRLCPPSLTPQSNDDGLYLLLGRSLRHLHYVDAHVVGAPIQAQYPPGYPGLLALGGALLGDGLWVAHATTILASLVALLLVFDVARRLVGTVPALGLLAALVLNVQFLSYASSIASEQPYLAASAGALWALVVLPESGRRLWIAGGLGILAALTRSIGVTLVLAIGLLWLSERRYRAVAVFALLAAATVGAWLVWTALAPDQFSERSYSAALTRAYAHRDLLAVLSARISRFVEVNIVRAPLAGLNVPSLPGTIIDNVAWLLLIIALAIPGFMTLWRRARIIPLYFIVFLIVLCLYPYKLTRFYMPVVPLQLLAMLVGLERIGRGWSPRLLQASLLAICLGIAARNAVDTRRDLAEASACRSLTTATYPACFPPEGRAFLAAARFAAESLPPDAAVLTIKEAPFFYYTGHLVMHQQLPVVHAPDRVIDFITARGVEYVLLSAYPGGAMVANALVPDCGRLELLLRVEPATYLLRVRSPGDPPARQDACAAIQEGIRLRPEATRP